MKTRLVTFLSLLTIAIIAAPQALALEIKVNDRGVINFYEDHVLGRNTDSVNPTSTSRPIKTIPAYADKKVYLKANADETTVELRKTPNSNRGDFVSTETMKSDRVKMSFPAKLDDGRDDNESGQGYLEKIRTERTERTKEMVELKNRFKEKKQVLELKSRNVKASLKNGAEFVLDPITNEVTITTPSGEERVLNHLPDQAIEKMEAAGLFFGISDDAEEELEVETNESGELIYTKKDQIEKKLFGIFPRQVDSKIILNDATGEVTEVELAPNSIFEQFFNAISF